MNYLKLFCLLFCHDLLELLPRYNFAMLIKSRKRKSATDGLKRNVLSMLENKTVRPEAQNHHEGLDWIKLHNASLLFLLLQHQSCLTWNLDAIKMKTSSKNLSSSDKTHFTSISFFSFNYWVVYQARINLPQRS